MAVQMVDPMVDLKVARMAVLWAALKVVPKAAVRVDLMVVWMVQKKVDLTVLL